MYSDKQSLFTELLEKDNSVFIHIRNIQSLAIEMFRISSNISPPITKVFKQTIVAITWQISEFSRPLVKSVYHGSENVSFQGPKIYGCKDIDTMRSQKLKLWKVPGKNSSYQEF